MATVSMAQVKELRERTQAGMSDCKKSLVEADGDIEKAVELILKKGLVKSAKRAGAAASEGVVATESAADAKSAVIVEVNIQTDFAARNDDFKKFAADILTVAAVADDGADIGAMTYPGSDATVEDTRKALVGKLGENITVRRWSRLRVEAGILHSYVHMGGKIAALLGVKTSKDVSGELSFKKFVDDCAMQIAAMGPLYVHRSQIDDAAKAKKSKFFNEQLEEEGKPEAVRPKIIEGKLNKWMREICLLEQQSVVDGDNTVDKLREALETELGAKISLTELVRYECGEGVEKAPEKDFAEEARAMAGT